MKDYCASWRNHFLTVNGDHAASSDELLMVPIDDAYNILQRGDFVSAAARVLILLLSATWVFSGYLYFILGMKTESVEICLVGTILGIWNFFRSR